MNREGLTARVAGLKDRGRVLFLLLLALAGAVGSFVLVSGAGEGLDRQLQTWRDGVRNHPATGKLVLVEIDARSLASIDRWPWPRGYYARAIGALNAAGVEMIGFDVDFSSKSTPDQDAAFAGALERSRAPVIVPSFQQPSSEGGGSVVESLPIAALRDHAMIGSVNIFADRDALVRSYPYGFRLGGTPRPSMGALIAGANGRIDRSFPIDGAIDPATVPRISFIDLIEGKLAPGQLAGRTVLVGATALELGDRYPMPRHGVVPGALIQLLAAETLIQGTSPTDFGAALPLLIVLILIAFSLRLKGRRRALAHGLAPVALLVLPLVLEAAHLGTVEVVPALAALLAAAGARAVIDALVSAQQARLADPDTGLPNRRAFVEEIRSDRRASTIVGLRVESYGDVLGVMGQAAAAELMARVSERALLSAAGPVYRVEENALAWRIDDIGDEPDHALEAVAAMLRPGIEIAGRRVELQSSLGVAVAQPGDAEDAIGRALLAANTASANGARWERYSEELGSAHDWQLSLAGEVAEALAAGEIWVAYQPKLDLETGAISSAEALVRWNHRNGGSVSPAKFIPVLETSGKIYDLTLYVLERALGDMRRWQDAGRTVRVAVNVSALLPSDPRFPIAVDRLLSEYAIPPDHLTLEVTESVSLNDPEAAIAALERLAATGVRLSIDDYGTGQSTLSYLKRLPAREIKIDQSFVKDLDASRSDQAMVRSTIELAHELGFKVVAEGVETAAVLELLRGFGCDTAQGWLIGRPVPAANFSSHVEVQINRAAA
jgi:EAL domain-containing protein (putative c-di-GMP-specific phosphodiesterase class I)/CHASE2 domain-containing sensor protein